MTHTPWYQRARHFRLLRDRLFSEGFEVLDAWNGRHLRIKVCKGGEEGTITCSSTPCQEEEAVNRAVQQARRIARRAVSA